MFRTCLLFLTILVIVITVATSKSDSIKNNKISCVTSLHELEESLKSNPLNIESVDDGFFPSNQGPSKWVIIKVYYNISNKNHDIITTHPNEFGVNSFNTIPDYVFYWFDSALLLYFDPQVIEILCFWLLSSERANIVIDPPCYNYVHLLNKLILKVSKIINNAYNILNFCLLTVSFVFIIAVRDTSRIF